MGSTARPVVDALIVGKAFVKQYYHILYNMPEHLHRFYQEISKVGRVGQDGIMHDFSTLQGITEELKALSYEDFKSAQITSFDTQESHSGGFLLVVNGYFTLTERLKRKFIQTFFLAPQENGYFVLNDILRFVSDPEAIGAEAFSGKDSETPCPIKAPTGKKDSEQAACVSVNLDGKKVSRPLNNENASVAKVNVLVPEIMNEEVSDVEIKCKEVADDSLKNYDPNDGLEGIRKKSYASVVTNDKSGDSAGSSVSPNQKEHQASSAPSLEHILQDQATSDPSEVIESEAVPVTADAAENGQNQGFEGVGAEGTSVYVKHLPANATIEMLETEFKQFGAIINGGSQVIIQRGYVGFPYGFVEFEEADAAQRAIEASPITIGGQKAFVEEKRSTSKGNRGGNGNGYGYRNVGVRGRRNYGYGNNYRRAGSFNRKGGNEFVASINTY